ncbi:MAG: tRNA (guanosine(37)-N1)-methyltransferase TrmD [Rhodobacteraceae bacterium]|nr:tRNA (guanosine(37)-N1)-methyltransferase TrmD [Paracoccaceae bacterium]
MSEPGKPRSHGRLQPVVSLRPRDLMADSRAVAGAWRAKVITLFPQAFPGTLGLSLTGKALDQGLWTLEPIDLRSFGEGKHRNVDDTPAGGGAGMVLRADVMARALGVAAQGTPGDRAQWPVIYLSPRGRPFTQARARALAQGAGVTLICGRFEGLDQRVIDHFGVEEVSLGDFVLSGGEIAAQALIDATVRLIPRVLGNQASTEEESFSEGLLEHPHYTRPATWQGRDIPEVLLSGDHGKVADWRRDMAERLTKERRPDLWRAYRDGHDRDPDGDQEL